MDVKLGRYLAGFTAFSADVVLGKEVPVLILLCHPRILELLIEKILQPIFSHPKSNVRIPIFVICNIIL